jgi:drug/metabolite transporter (DMT)-like permease
MPWWTFALSGALLTAVYYLLVKHSLRRVDLFILGGGVFLSTSFLLTAVSLIRGIPDLETPFYSSVAATVLLNIAASFLYLKSLKTTDLSLSLPMISMTPVFLILTSFLLLGELPSPSGSAGIAMIVAGSYVLNTTPGNRVWDPFRCLVKNPGIRRMLAVAFLYSLSANFDKLAVLHSDPYFSSAAVYLLLGIFFLAAARLRHPDLLSACRRDLPFFLLAGAVQASAAVAINLAFTLQIVPYVIAVKRLSIFFGVLGGGLFLGEPDLLRRGLGALIMLAGVAMILLG